MTGAAVWLGMTAACIGLLAFEAWREARKHVERARQEARLLSMLADQVPVEFKPALREIEDLSVFVRDQWVRS